MGIPGLAGYPEDAETLRRTRGLESALLRQQGLQILGHKDTSSVGDSLSALVPVWGYGLLLDLWEAPKVGERVNGPGLGLPLKTAQHQGIAMSVCLTSSVTAQPKCHPIPSHAVEAVRGPLRGSALKERACSL